MRPQVRVDGIAHLVGAPVFREIDMRDLAQRMHARIGAAGARDPHGMAAQRRESIGEHALHRGRVVLPLPAGERRSVVFDGELVAGHAPA